MDNFPQSSIHWRNKVSLNDGEDKKGIIGDEKDLQYRLIKYGDNIFPEQ